MVIFGEEGSRGNWGEDQNGRVLGSRQCFISYVRLRKCSPKSLNCMTLYNFWCFMLYNFIMLNEQTRGDKFHAKVC